MHLKKFLKLGLVALIIAALAIPLMPASPVSAAAIDIGAAAIGRPVASTPTVTRIGLNNPANLTGTITTIEIWCEVEITGCKVGTFYGSGTNYTNRDYETIGTVTPGSKQTFSDLSIDVVAGDFIGAYFATGATGIEEDSTGGSGIYYLSGDQFGTGLQTYTIAATSIMSVYGIGSTDLPTITLSAATNIEDTTATLNGNVTDAGGDNPTVTVYWGDEDGGQTPGSWDYSSEPTSPSQPQGVAAFYKNVTGLNPGVTYYFSAKATNTAGTDWPDASLSFNSSSVPVNYRVGASTDSPLVWGDGATWDIGYIYTVRVGYQGTGATKTGSGMRWTGVAIPAGSTITSAYIKFYAAVAHDLTVVNSVIIGGKEPNPATFSSLGNFQARRGTIVGGSNDNYITTASVNWNAIPAWAGAEYYDSPDITTIMQEIIDQAGWTSGNSLVLYWDDFAGNSTTTDNTFREAASYGTIPAEAPELYVTYTCDKPTITTSAADDITEISATLNGNITSSGSTDVTARGFYWGTTTNYGNTLADSTSPPFSTGPYGLSLSGLENSTVYHFKAYATNTGGTVEGSDQYFSTSAGAGADYLQGYGYTQQFTITGSTGGAGTNIQIPIHVYKGPGSSSGSVVYLGGNCSHFPNDLNFTAGDGSTILDFWIESYTSTEAWIWVEVPSIPASPGTTSCYIYYGNPLVTVSVSNGEDTFNHFSDFTYSMPVLYNGGTPVLPFGGAGAWDDNTHSISSHSTVIVGGVWYTYYCAFTVATQAVSTGMATSADGINWTKNPSNPIWTWSSLGLPSWQYGTWDPCVLYVDGVFMLYVGVHSAGDNAILLTSTDGFNFTQHQPVLDSGWNVTDLSFSYNPNTGVYNAWGGVCPSAGDWAHQVPFTIPSLDGESFKWADRQMLTIPGEGDGVSSGAPLVAQVFFDGTTEYMLYWDPLYWHDPPTPQGYDAHLRVGLAKSLDNGITWTTVNRDIIKGCDPRLIEVSPDVWNMQLCYNTYRDYPGTNSYTVLNYSGTLDQMGSFSTDTSWVNFLDGQASVIGGELVIDKTASDQKGIQYVSQLPSTALVGFKMTNLSANTADVSILDITGSGAAGTQAAVQQLSTGVLQGLVNPGSTTTNIGSGSLGLQYSCVMEIQSSTVVAALVRGYDPISMTRSSTTSNFLHLGWFGATANFSVDDIFIGNIVTPNPTITSWTGGEANNALTTDGVSGITLTNARLHGTITNIIDGHTITIIGFDYGTTTSCDTPAVKATSTYGLGSYFVDIAGLTANQLYYFRAKMFDDTASTWTYGTTLSFTTTPVVLPVIVTGVAIDKTPSEATLQGTLTSLGDYSTVYVYFQYGPTTAYTLGSTLDQTKTEPCSYSQSISGLSESTTYHFRSVVRYGTSSIRYGDDATFTTTRAGEPGQPGIDPPETLLIEDVRIFTNFLEGGDLLIVSAYRLLYEVTPIEVVGDYFVIQMKEGEVLKCQGIPSSWGYRPTSLYQAPGHSLILGSSYTEHLVGRLDQWTTPPEATFAIGPGSWVIDDLTILDSWVLATAARIGTYYGVDLVMYVAGYGQQLTTEGGEIFEQAIPGLKAERPHLFSSGAREIKRDTVKRESTWREDFTIENKMGEGIAEDFDDAGGFFGLEGKLVGAIIWAVLCIGIVAAGIVATGSTLIGILLGLAWVVGGSALGLLGAEYLIIFAVGGIICAVWVGVARGV